MKIAIIGSGALGLYYGALLQRGGHDVHFFLRSDYDAITTHGLTVHSINGDFHLPVIHGHRDPALIGTVDLVLVGLKTFANDRLADLISPLLAAATRILTLQNGLGNEECLSKLFGGERVLGGVAFLCSNRGEPGHVHHLAAGRIIIGSYGSDIETVRNIADEFVNSGIDCKTTDDLGKTRWEKLVWNIPFNGLCALLQQSVDQVLKTATSRKLVRELMLEVVRAANAQSLSKPLAESYAESMITFSDGMGVYKPSMQIDREEGRELELEAIFRIPLAYGTTQGIAMPRVEMLVTLLEQITKS
jgi:2-dehydropantoate 2-reductase